MGQLIVSIPGTAAGIVALQHLQGPGAEFFRVRYIESLADRLRRGRLESAASLANLSESFHLLEVPAGDELTAIIRLSQFHNQPEPLGTRGKIDAVELNYPATLSAPNAQLDSVNHPANLGKLNVAAAHQNGVKGNDIRVAVVDTGSDGLAYIKDFYDLLISGNQHPGTAGQRDNHGHGTTMASILHAVACDAEICPVRISDNGTLAVWDILAGVCVAAIDCAADIISLSLGVPDLGGSPCPWCGSLAHVRSLAFEKLLDGLAQRNAKRPIFVAATGNDGRATGFHYPGAYSIVAATGSINRNEYRSQFSNYGTAGHRYYWMAPGGETQPNLQAVTEPVDQVNGKDNAGTSEATAYAAGMLALFRSETVYRNKDRSDFLDAIVQNHCVAPSHTSPAPADYGAGLIRYSPPPSPLPPPLPAPAAASEIVDMGSYVLIRDLKVPKRIVLRLIDTHKDQLREDGDS
jgi:hypothetical protein